MDLDGVQILVPAFITALEIVLPDKDLILRSNYFNKTELRRSSIHLLLSMLALPLHFQNLPIRSLFGTNDKYVYFKISKFYFRKQDTMLSSKKLSWILSENCINVLYKRFLYVAG